MNKCTKNVQRTSTKWNKHIVKLIPTSQGKVANQLGSQGFLKQAYLEFSVARATLVLSFQTSKFLTPYGPRNLRLPKFLKNVLSFGIVPYKNNELYIVWVIFWLYWQIITLDSVMNKYIWRLRSLFIHWKACNLFWQAKT